MKNNKRHRMRGILKYFLLFSMASCILLPLVMTFVNSFMSKAEILQYFGYVFGARFDGDTFFHFVPNYFTLEGYYQILFRQPDYLYKFWISLFIALGVVAGQLVVGCSGGYAFSKFHFPLKNSFFLLIVILMMMPQQVTLVPNYIILEKLGLIGSYWSVILPGMFSAFGIFLMRQIMAAVPDELMQAGKIDGANQLAILLKIMIPSCKAGIASLIILVFIDAWNMVEQPLVFLKDNYKYPLSVFLTNINSAKPGVAFACSVLSIVPVSLLFLLFEDELVKGIEYSIIK